MADAKGTDDSPPFHGPQDDVHKAVHEAVKGLRSKTVVPDARKQLGDALAEANKVKTDRLPDGSHRAPSSKAFRYGK